MMAHQPTKRELARLAHEQRINRVQQAQKARLDLVKAAGLTPSQALGLTNPQLQALAAMSRSK